MLNKVIHSYQNAKLSAIRKFSNQEYDILEEPGFLDNGFIRMKIVGLKKEAKKIDQQIEQLLQFDKRDDYHKQKVGNFLDQKDSIHIHMAFLASNSFQSLEFSKQLIQPLNIDFSLCLEALTHYKEEREIESFKLFEMYFAQHPNPLDHFLINKVYGLLLLKNNLPEKAVVFLRKAAEKRPEEHEVQHYLINAYETLGLVSQSMVHKEILVLLGGANNDNN